MDEETTEVPEISIRLLATMLVALPQLDVEWTLSYADD
jgi:hypothetical protein